MQEGAGWEFVGSRAESDAKEADKGESDKEGERMSRRTLRTSAKVTVKRKGSVCVSDEKENVL